MSALRMLSAVGVLSLFAHTASADDEPESKAALKAVEAKASWGPGKGPDGRSDHANTAVIPSTIMDVILADLQRMVAGDLEESEQAAFQKVVEDRLRGRGPSAGFRRERTADGGLRISNPRTFAAYELLGGPEQGWEVGAWQPAVHGEAAPIEGGYRWNLSWMVQAGWEKHRRAYRVDVRLEGVADQESGGIRYSAVWKGPYAEMPVDLSTIPPAAK